MPVTVKPALANSTARGSPTYPNPTTPTRARLVRIFSARICAVAAGKVSSGDSVIKPVFSHSARGRAEKHAPARLFQHAPHDGAQLFGGERFLQIHHGIVQYAVAAHDAVGVARHEYDLGLRPELLHALRQFLAVHTGH